MSKNLIINLVLWISLLAFGANCFAQTSDFVYQGKLNDGAATANGSYQFEFRLYDAATGGNQIGNAVSNLPATVTNGIFAVNLDFGANAFDGAARFLEISVRLNGSGQNYTTLNPRQAVTSTPYAVKSLKANEATTAATATNSQNLGGVSAANYTQANDARLSDARTPTAFSTYYIQNGMDSQAASNFNISGEGKADKLTAATQFNLGSSRVLGGASAQANLFIGAQAGEANPAAGANTFVGVNSGKSTNTGFQNSFFGQSAGLNNLGGRDNSFFGNFVGGSNTSGNANAFFGAGSGFGNTEGSDNAFFGMESGANNTTGNNNTFLGRLSGLSNTTENNNTFIGFQANGAAGITNATAIGANAVATQSNSMVLGTSSVTVKIPGSLNVVNTFSANNFNSATNYQIGGNSILSAAGTNNIFAGADAGTVSTGGFNAFFGTQAGKFNSAGFNNTFVGYSAGRANTTGNYNAYFGASAGLFGNGSSNSFFGNSAGGQSLSGGFNSFFGRNAGLNNSGSENAFFGANTGKANTGTGNSFFGDEAGLLNTSGNSNVFIGKDAAPVNTISSNNTFVGKNTAPANTSGNGNTFIGSGAGSGVAGGSNNIFLGANAGGSGDISNSIAIGANVLATASNTVFLGKANQQVQIPGSASLGSSLAVANNVTVGGGATFNGALSVPSAGFQANSDGLLISKPATLLDNLEVRGSTFLKGDVTISQSNLDITGDVQIDGEMHVTELGVGMLNANDINVNNGKITTGKLFVFNELKLASNLNGGGDGDLLCQDEDDYTVKLCVGVFAKMKNAAAFDGGLKTINKLRAVTFNSGDSNRQSVGLIADNPETLDSTFVKRDAKGAAQGVKYVQVITALVGATQEQQAQIEKQQEQIKQQQTQIELLKVLVCQSNSNAAVCQK